MIETVRSPEGIYAKEDIKPSVYYVQQALSSLRDSNGDLVVLKIANARKSGRIPHKEDEFKRGRVRFLYLGADVVAFLDNIERDIDAARESAVSTYQDKNFVERLILKNIELSKENKNLYLLNENIINEYNNKLEDIDSREKKLLSDESRQKYIINKVLDKVFGESKVYSIEKNVLDRFCGIYFLMKDNSIVYIGQSVNIISRISQHKIDGKDFNQVRFFECEKERLNDTEMFFIKLFKPPLNGAYKNGRIPEIPGFFHEFFTESNRCHQIEQAETAGNLKVAR